MAISKKTVKTAKPKTAKTPVAMALGLSDAKPKKPVAAKTTKPKTVRKTAKPKKPVAVKTAKPKTADAKKPGGGRPLPKAKEFVGLGLEDVILVLMTRNTHAAKAKRKTDEQLLAELRKQFPTKTFAENRINHFRNFYGRDVAYFERHMGRIKTAGVKVGGTHVQTLGRYDADGNDIAPGKRVAG